MAQYCRYCSFCIYGDMAYCTDHEKILSDDKIRRVNHCKDFDLSPLGDVITGRIYTPRRTKQIEDDKEEQISLELIVSATNKWRSEH